MNPKTKEELERELQRMRAINEKISNDLNEKCRVIRLLIAAGLVSENKIEEAEKFARR